MFHQTVANHVINRIHTAKPHYRNDANKLTCSRISISYQGKVKLSLFLSKYHAMKMSGGKEA